MALSSWKLRLAPLVPALAAAITAGAVLWQLLPATIERSAAQQLLDTSKLLAPMIAARWSAAQEEARATGAAPEAAAAELESWVRALPATSELRVTVLALDGTVLADSAVVPAAIGTLENHAGRPEVREALVRGEGSAMRGSATTGVEYVYAARRITTADGGTLLLRLAQPVAALDLLRSRLAVALLPSLGAALVALLVVSLWLDRRFLKPLLDIIAGAGRMAGGEHEPRIALPEDDQLRSLASALNRLSVSVQHQVRAAEDERDHLRTILASMSEGVLVVGPDGHAQYGNPAFARLFSLADDVTGRAALEISRHPRLAEIIQATLEGGSSETAELEIELPEQRSLSLASASLGLGQGAVVVARDTTAFTLLTKMRRDFVANVSHELKTPLSAIRGYAETLRDGALDDAPAARRFTERILVQCRRLQALLDDLLTLSRLESVDTAALPVEKVELASLVERAVELVGETAREKAVEIKVELEPVPPVAGHPASLERLAVNLLDNAVKYNRPGGKVAVALAARQASVVLQVIDTGIGIPASSLPRLFERFYRVDKGRSREEGGTGLGLAIVKHIAQLHGGRVEVESKEGIGSTFRVTLPAA